MGSSQKVSVDTVAMRANIGFGTLRGDRPRAGDTFQRISLTPEGFDGVNCSRVPRWWQTRHDGDREQSNRGRGIARWVEVGNTEELVLHHTAQQNRTHNAEAHAEQPQPDRATRDEGQDGPAISAQGHADPKLVRP